MSGAERLAPAIGAVTYNSLEDLTVNHAAHLRVAEALAAPLVVVDNASTDGTVPFLRSSAESSGMLRVIESAENRGYAWAVNRAFEAAGDRDFLLINPDVALDVGAVERLVELLEAAPEAGVIGPALIAEDGNRQSSARRFPTIAAMLGSSEKAAGRSRRLAGAYDAYLEPGFSSAAREVDWLIGAAMLIRRTAFATVGGWDERFFLYMEDADFCRRLVRAGWSVRIEPEVMLTHTYKQASSAGDASVVSSQARRRHIVSLARFWAREPGLLVGRGRG